MNEKSLRWFGVVSLCVIIVVSYIDRINIAMLITDQGFLDHIGLARSDRVAQGLLATAFMVGYGISSIVLTPFAATLLGVRRSLICGLTLWGVVTFLSPTFNSFGLLLASRLLLGLAEGPLFPLATAYSKVHFASHETGKPNAIIYTGSGLGLAVGFPIVGWLMANYDWQTSFHVLGVMNVLIGIPLVLAFIRAPLPAATAGKPVVQASSLPGPAAKPNENANAAAAAAAAATSTAAAAATPAAAVMEGTATADPRIGPMARVGTIVRDALRTRHLLLFTVLTGVFLAFQTGSSNWLPAYLQEARGFSLRELGWIASLPQYSAVVGVLVGGVLVDRIASHRVPFIFLAGSTGVALSVWAAIISTDRGMAAACLVAANAFWGLMSPSIPSTVQRYSKPEHIASAFGTLTGIGSLVAGLMPMMMGMVIAAVSGGHPDAATSGAGFFAGFGMLIGTQVVVFGCGLLLWWRQRSERAAVQAPANPDLVEPRVAQST